MSTSRISKFLKKTALVFPFILAVWLVVYDKLEFDHLFFPVVASLILSLLMVFYNLFDYEKYDGMLNEDFLESGHSIRIENSDSHWKIIYDIVESNFSWELKERNDKLIKLRIERKVLDSELIITRVDHQILIEIKKKHLPFFPDRAENYRTIKRLEKRIKTIASRK